MLSGKKANIELIMTLGILAILLVLLLMTSRINLQSSLEEEVSSVVHTHNKEELQSVANDLTFVTKIGIPLEELLGVYSCYGQNTADYGGGINFDIWEEIRTNLDKIFGEEFWALQLEEVEMEFPLDLTFIYDASGSITERGGGTRSDLEKTTILKNIIAPTSKLIGLDDINRDNPEVTNCRFGRGSPGANAATESWGSAVEYICNNGPPIPNGKGFDYNGWPANQPRVVFFISDEYSCSCGDINSGTDVPIDATIKYVDAAIATCNANDVIVFFLKPDTVPSKLCRDPPAMLREAERLAVGTGGIMVDIDNAEKAAEQIKEIIDIPERRVIITSKTILNVTNLPDSVDIYSYQFVYPLPCTEDRIGTAILYRWTQ